MERWYIGFRTVGSPVDLTTQLGRLIRQYALGDFVARACYEKSAGNKRHGEYYFFIGVVSEEKGDLPDESRKSFTNMLSNLKLRDIGAYVYYDDIQTMASKEIEAFNFRQIKMVSLSRYQPTDPFNYTVSITEEPRASETNPSFNHLLYWLSAYGRGTWQQFRAACTELGIDPNGEYAKLIARRLRSLGHIEMTNNGQNWVIAPPCLVQTETTDSHYYAFLAGQRSPRLIEALDREAHVSVESHPYGNAPEVVRVMFTSQADAQDFVKGYTQHHHLLYLAGRADLRIASALPDLAAWELSLPVLSLVKGNYSYEQWMDNSFYHIELPKETGLYRLTHVSTRFEQPQLTLFYNAESDTWRKGDWYGLRYLMLHRTGQSCEFHYDHKLNTLSIARDHRLPDLYERSLILASGQLPIYRHEQVIFGSISETLAHMLASKLEAKFIEYRGV